MSFSLGLGTKQASARESIRQSEGRPGVSEYSSSTAAPGRAGPGRSGRVAGPSIERSSVLESPGRSVGLTRLLTNKDEGGGPFPVESKTIKLSV